MTVNQQTLLFFDASALFLAAGTPSGGSGFSLRVCRAGFFRACASPVVLHETERNLFEKASYDALLTHREQVADASFALVPVPSPAVLAQFTETFAEDDHVVASTVASRAAFLITLDRPLIKRAESSNYSFIPITPGDFLETRFLSHPDYELIRRTVI